jgi:hypothetical protein
MAQLSLLASLTSGALKIKRIVRATGTPQVSEAGVYDSKGLHR